MSHRAPPILIALAFVAFVSLGLPDCVLGVAWPSVRHTFARPLSHVGALLAAGTAGYLCSSFLGGQILRTFGVGRLLLGSCLLVAASLAGYGLAPNWPTMIACAVVGGLGAGAIDTGINTVAASRFSPRIVNWLHASWGIGATTGPLLMTAVLASHHGWRVGYAILAGTMLLLSLLFFATLRLWDDASTAPSPEHAAPHASVLDALRRPVVLLQVLLFFLYCGIESTAGQLLYTLFTESRGVGLTTAGVTVAAYWAALTIGRIVFGQLAHSLGRRAVLRAGMTLAPVAALLIAWNAATTMSIAGTVLLGFALAPVFPTLISVTPERVGPAYAPHAVGFQVAAASIGIATFPGVVGLLARSYGLEIVCAYLVAASLAVLALHELILRVTPSYAPRQGTPTPLATPTSA